MTRTFAAFVVLAVIAAALFAAWPAYAAYPGHNGRIAFQADTGGGTRSIRYDPTDRTWSRSPTSRRPPGSIPARAAPRTRTGHRMGT
jgi:hypothetical protein